MTPQSRRFVIMLSPEGAGAIFNACVWHAGLRGPAALVRGAGDVCLARLFRPASSDDLCRRAAHCEGHLGRAPDQLTRTAPGKSSRPIGKMAAVPPHACHLARLPPRTAAGTDEHLTAILSPLCRRGAHEAPSCLRLSATCCDRA